MPWISRRRSKPFVTPSTMLATSVRVRPCRARSSPRSVGRVTTSWPSVSSTFIRCGTCWESSPSGPFTITRPGEIETDTPAGTSIGLFPILLKRFSPDKTDDFAADAAFLRRAARDEPVGRGHDRGAHAPEHARQAVLARVHPTPRLRDPLEVRDDPLAVLAELQLYDE